MIGCQDADLLLASSGTRGQLDTSSLASSLASSGAQRGDTNHCKPGTQHVWCLPRDYNLEKHPFSCEPGLWTALNIDDSLFSRFHPGQQIPALGL